MTTKMDRKDRKIREGYEVCKSQTVTKTTSVAGNEVFSINEILHVISQYFNYVDKLDFRLINKRCLKVSSGRMDFSKIVEARLKDLFPQANFEYLMQCMYLDDAVISGDFVLQCLYSASWDDDETVVHSYIPRNENRSNLSEYLGKLDQEETNNAIFEGHHFPVWPPLKCLKSLSYNMLKEGTHPKTECYDEKQNILGCKSIISYLSSNENFDIRKVAYRVKSKRLLIHNLDSLCLKKCTYSGAIVKDEKRKNLKEYASATENDEYAIREYRKYGFKVVDLVDSINKLFF